MVQTPEGRLKAIETIKKRYPNFYTEFSKKGGQVKGIKKGFASDPEKARLAGERGREQRRLNKLKRLVEEDDSVYTEGCCGVGLDDFGRCKDCKEMC